MTTITSPKLKVINNHAYASSIDVANKFHKQHFHVMREIENLIIQIQTTFNESESGVNTSKNGCIERDFLYISFEPQTYKDSRNREQKFYYLTRDAFALLAMSFTGQRAMTWKLRYMASFNAMEFQLNQKAMQSHNWEQLTLRFPDVAETLHDTYPSMTVTYALGRLTELGLMIPPVSRNQIISLIKNGKLQGFKDDRQWCIYTDSFNHFVKLRSGQFA